MIIFSVSPCLCVQIIIFGPWRLCVSNISNNFVSGNKVSLFVFGINGLDLLAHQIHVILELLYLAVHLVNKIVAFFT